MRRLLFTFLFLLFWVHGFAQNKGWFKAIVNGVEVTELCAGQTVEFQNFSCNGTETTLAFYKFEPASFSGPIIFGPTDLNTPGRLYQVPSTPGLYVVGQLYTATCDPQEPQMRRTFLVKPAPQPTFTATQCGPDSVLVTLTDTNYDTYTVAVGNKSPEPITVNQSKYFESPGGTYNIIVTGTHTAGNCGFSSTKSVTATPAPAMPTISSVDLLETAASGRIEIKIMGLQSGYTYSLEGQNGSIFTEKTRLNFNGNATETVVLSNLNTAVANCFRVRVFDACGRSQHPNPNIPVICSQPIQVVAGNKKNIVSWPSYSGNTPGGGSYSYQLRRQEGSNSTIFNLPANQTTYEDSEVTCGQEYCYELAVLEGANAFSLSNTACATVVSTDIPGMATLITSFNPDNSLQGTLTLTANTALKEQTVFKNRNGGGYVQTQKSNAIFFTDTDKNLASGPVCYKVTYTDNCGNLSPESNESCPVILTAKHDKLKRTVTLNWTEYVGFSSPQLTYTLELLDENFSPESSQLVTGTFSLNDQKLSDTDQILRYRIKVEGAAGELSYSNTQTIVQDVKIFIPTAFSPNNDGLNDIFEVKGRFQNNFSLVILNRWGQVVFESNDPKKGWDGKMNGKEAPIGAYAYKLRTIDEQGKRIERTGTLTLLR
ncbi:gliding motility-associated C-terminal domain-containing protein [Adhaeribacter soli]|uniref:Gliding motility-associated C-terminal domain-containing protein n=1 Tax=Adhaeribacter soli TaxID=2607655 RepID=A0A5N1J4J2_9BACT|nr:gliding motility-associated C-terminal domain-containing protein [Adhaeribacter soli]KAA9345826.1 gliding motility-associated C-terminal domain-containing protein [Adhaeribacter soli]